MTRLRCTLPWPEACKACNRTARGLQIENLKMLLFFIEKLSVLYLDILGLLDSHIFASRQNCLIDSNCRCENGSRASGPLLAKKATFKCNGANPTCFFDVLASEAFECRSNTLDSVFLSVHCMFRSVRTPFLFQKLKSCPKNLPLGLKF